MTCYRELLRGINAFAHAKATWDMYYFTPWDNYFRFIEQLKPNGLILGPLESVENTRKVAAMVSPCVAVCALHQLKGIDSIITVDCDDDRVGAAAADHLLQKGYRDFAFAGVNIAWSNARLAAFEREIAKAGFNCSVLKQEWDAVMFGQRVPRLLAWLRTLHRPVGMLACNDVRGRVITQVCRNEGIRIPDDIAVLGVDDDDLDCALSDPPLSSIAVPWRRIGFDAATLLDQSIEGERIECRSVSVPPLGVVERQSTDSIAISDPDVVAAIRYIREHAHEPISVDDILWNVPIARRSLEQRFRSILHRSILDEIHRAHVERAKQLLATTDMSIKEIARRSGFGRGTWFSVSFRKLVGESPAQFRKRLHRE